MAKQTWIGFGSNERTTPAISVILCLTKQTENQKERTNMPTKNSQVFGTNLKNISSDPQLITSRNTNSRTNLKLPLFHASTSQPFTGNLWRNYDLLIVELEDRRKGRKKEEYSLNWAHLSRHNFSINSTDVNSSIEAGLIVWIYYITTKCLVCPYTTIVGALHGYKAWIRSTALFQLWWQ